MSTSPRLSPHQRLLLDSWLPGHEVVADHSWGQTDMVVLEVESAEGRVIVKASGPDNGHLARDVRGHRKWTGPWARAGRAARLLHADVDARVLVCTYLPGNLVEGTPAQSHAETFRQAGQLLAQLHAQEVHRSTAWHARLRQRVEGFLEQPHRIAPRLVSAIRREVSVWDDRPVELVPTHGDWQPRNWLIDGTGTVRIIDLGRADLRPREEDFVRLGRQDFHHQPALETAFLEGYGRDPRDPELWRRMNVVEAVGTAVWAHRVRDVSFEQLGHQHLQRLFHDESGPRVGPAT